MLTVLSVSYALAAVTPDAAGGAEVVLAQLDAALAARGDRSIVVAPAGSRVRGALVRTPAPPAVIDDPAWRRAQRAHKAAIARALDRHPVDLVHCHGLDFLDTLPATAAPVIATLHLDPATYGPRLADAATRATLACVSRPQWRRLPPALRGRAAVIPNGVDVRAYRFRRHKLGYALFLGRICPEKGVDRAIAACRAAGVPLVIAGAVHPYPAHLRFFDEQVRPHLGDGVHWVGPVARARKRALLAGARALLVPSSVPETSSLVAMEALASGTPVIAAPVGALPAVVDDGTTGILADDAAAIAAALREVGDVDPAACRAAAEARFDVAVTVARYLDLYGRVARPRARAA